MNEAELMRQHTLFQKSFTGYTCNHGNTPKVTPSRPVTRNSSHRDTRSRLENGMTVTNYSGQRHSDNINPNSQSNYVLPPLMKGRSSPAIVTPPRTFARQHSRVKPKPPRPVRPWREPVPPLSDNTNKHIELHYAKTMPKDKWMEYKPRQYVSNAKYGSIYEIRKDVTDSREPVPPPSSWLWEEEYKLWRLDERRPPPRSFTRRSFSRRKLGKLPVDKPHPELFAAYHSEKLDKQKRQVSAVVIQRHTRGWLVRKSIRDLKRQTVRSLGMSWPAFVKDYKETIRRIQSRYGVMKTECRFDVKEVEEFIGRREKCERVYEKMVRYGKMEKSELPEFFRQCGLHPTDEEISKAFNTIYRGSRNTAEIVFVLDCSASLGPVNFRNQTNFVKDVVQGFDISPDRVRVGIVPDNSIQSFDLTQFKTKAEVLEAVDKLEFRNGISRTDLALKMMRQLFKYSRPGVKKIGLVCTDGKSSEPGLTIKEAKLARDENIELFAIGVGYTVQTHELEAMTGDKQHVKTCSDLSTIKELKDIIKNRICIACCVLCHHILPRIEEEGLLQSEVLDILWTIFPPLASRLEGDMNKLNPRPYYDDNILKKTDYKKCLSLVIQAKLEREGFIEIPSDLRLGVERVSNLEEALEKVDAYLRMQQQQKKEQEEAALLSQTRRVLVDVPDCPTNDQRPGEIHLMPKDSPPRDTDVQILKIDHPDDVERSGKNRDADVQILEINHLDNPEISTQDILDYRHDLQTADSKLQEPKEGRTDDGSGPIVKEINILVLKDASGSDLKGESDSPKEEKDDGNLEGFYGHQSTEPNKQVSDKVASVGESPETSIQQTSVNTGQGLTLTKHLNASNNIEEKALVDSDTSPNTTGIGSLKSESLIELNKTEDCQETNKSNSEIPKTSDSRTASPRLKDASQSRPSSVLDKTAELDGRKDHNSGSSKTGMPSFRKNSPVDRPDSKSPQRMEKTALVEDIAIPSTARYGAFLQEGSKHTKNIEPSEKMTENPGKSSPTTSKVSISPEDLIQAPLIVRTGSVEEDSLESSKTAENGFSDLESLEDFEEFQVGKTNLNLDRWNDEVMDDDSLNEQNGDKGSFREENGGKVSCSEGNGDTVSYGEGNGDTVSYMEVKGKEVSFIEGNRDRGSFRDENVSSRASALSQDSVDRIPTGSRNKGSQTDRETPVKTMNADVSYIS